MLAAFRTQNAHEGKSRFDKEGGRYILILDNDEQIIGKLYSKSITTLQVLDKNDEVVIQIKAGWSLKYLDSEGNETNIAKVKDKFAGAKSIFTKAHKWMVEFSPDIPDSQKELIKAAVLFNSLRGRANIKGLVGF